MEHFRRRLQLLKLCRLSHRTFSSREKVKAMGRAPGFAPPPPADAARIRNIGIMAHIDAGKTTTTERLLYYAGATRALGDVDAGDTVTDHMDQERERGITITSAAITLDWTQHQINLIDTPGHVDFTLEVERSLRVLDGAVGVLDASAGVEAQTLTVWRQADSFGLPALFFLNKMDKPGASLPKCLDSIRDKLRIQPLRMYTDLRSESGEFSGIYDLLAMQSLEWPLEKSQDGRSYKKTRIGEGHPSFETLSRAREDLIGSIAELDPEFEEILLGKELAELSVDDHISPAIARLTLTRKAAPVLCGSSLRNRGVQPLLDLIVKYLPSPLQRADPAIADCYGSSLCALAFKISHDKRKGPLTYFRVYNGRLASGQALFNVRSEASESGCRVYRAHSDELEELGHLGTGDIAVVAGLASSVTGDTFTDSKAAAADAARRHARITGDEESRFLLSGICAPEPVYFCSVEAPSPSAQLKLDEALAQLAREDPSLRVKLDPLSRQTVVEAMGELHMEIVRDRLIREWGLEVFVGPLQINYREQVDGIGETELEREEMIGDQKQRITIGLVVTSAPGIGRLRTLGIVQRKGETSLSDLRGDWSKAILRGAKAACDYGPLLGYPVQDVSVSLTRVVGRSRTSLAFISSVANAAAVAAMKLAGTSLLEPLMSVEIRCPASSEAVVLGELTRRRAEIRDVRLDGGGEDRIIGASAPLAELGGLAKAVRSLSSGTAGLHMALSGYQRMLPVDQQAVIDKATGKR